VRTAFESLLKHACQQFGLKVKCHVDPKKVPSSDLWGALKAAKYDFIPPQKCAFDCKGKVRWWQPPIEHMPIIPPPLRTRIEHAVSWVLNPLSHSQTVDRYRVEIEDAIYAIDDLEVAVKRAMALRSTRATVTYEMIAALLKAYIEKVGTGGS
jgi:hypothetical protein